jgi:thioredoxin reductase (NADPH)
VSAFADRTDLIETDAVVIGAGPAGLFSVFQLGLLEIRAHVVDALPQAGGQPVELYPDKPIFDIPAVPVLTGRELAQALLKQIEPFGATLHLGQEVTELERQDDGRFLLATSKGTRFLTRVVVIAGGVGAFQPKALKVPGLEPFIGRQIQYQPGDASAFAGKRVVVHGHGETAVGWAIRLAEASTDKPHRVTLLHRRDVFDATPEALARLQALRASGAIEVVIGQIVGQQARGDTLTALDLALPDGSTRSLPLDAMIVSLGLSPRLGPVAQWGLDMERKQLRVDTGTFATSEPGIFAIGDINTYPGKKKLLVSAFHECALAAYGAAAVVYPGKTLHLEYTTTSTRLHRLLGVTVQTDGTDPA